MQKQTLVILGLGLAVMSVPVWADDMGERKEGKMRRPHSSPSEVFQKIDVNGDGFVTAAEMLEHHRARVQQHFKRMDLDTDGKLTRVEMEEGGKALRDKMRNKWMTRKAGFSTTTVE